MSKKKFLTFNKKKLLDKVHSDDQEDWTDFYNFRVIYDSFNDYDYHGSVKNMDDYHTMNMLTLLRKLNLTSMKKYMKDRGW